MSASVNAKFYAKGYAEGLRDAKAYDVAALIVERDNLRAVVDLERLLRLDLERALADKAGEIVRLVDRRAA